MKKISLFFFGMCFIFLLCACTSKEGKQYTVTKNGTHFTVSTENSTISDGTYTYSYTFLGNASEYDATITYPDGSSYRFAYNNGVGSGGGSIDYNKEKYMDGYTLCEILQERAPKKSGEKHVGWSLLFLVIGILGVAFPRALWKLEIGWLVKNGEPSNFALGLYRFGGVLVIILAVVLIF